MLNSINIMGRLTQEPVLRHTEAGTPVLPFTLAVDRDFGGEPRGTDFIDCVAWRSTAEFISRNFTKGQPACVTGRLQIRGWVDRDGTNRRSAEVVVGSVYFAGGRPEHREAPEESEPEYDPYAEYDYCTRED